MAERTEEDGKKVEDYWKFGDAIETEIERCAAISFASHQVTELSRSGVFRSWQCAKPGSWHLAFTITTIPNCLILTGDVGDLIVERHYDMLPWCRGSCRSTGYFAEKVPNNIITTEFNWEFAEAWRQMELQNEDINAEYRCFLEDFDINDESTETELYRELSGYVDELPSFRVWTRRFLWCREAIRWFVTHHDEPVVVEPR